jgi:MFS family permease
VRAVVRGAAAIVVLALVGLALVAMSGTSAMVALFALLVIAGGASSGTITTLAPAMASLVARPEEQGDVMALTGTFRAGALLVAPAVVALTLTLAGIPAAVAVVAGGLGLPGLVLGRRGDSPPAAAVDEAGTS